MRKTFQILLFFSLVLILPLTLDAQSQRLVLLEHFTQASCGPCAAANPGVMAILNANPTKITSIKYQTSWPGYDPMNLHNPSDVAARVNVYGVTGVPRSVLDGNYYNGSASSWNIGTVNTRYAVTTPVEIQVQHQLNAAQDSIFVTMLVKATGPFSGNFGAYIGVIEKQISFATAPGSNGEKNFYNVMKKLLPNSAGTTLPSSMDAGDYVIIQSAWALANVYSVAQLGVVAWVQDRNSKEVYQAANSTTSAITPVYANDAAVMELLGIGDNWCSVQVQPTLVLRNQGSQTLTSAEIRYQVNGGQEQVYQWTGSLGFLDEGLIDLPVSSFTLGENNQLKAYIHSLNGSADDYHGNDTLKNNFVRAPGTSEKVYFFIRTDNKPNEITWELVDAQGNVAYSGGPYTQSGQIIQETFTLADGCYSFRLMDAGGDGICCTSGFGVYQLTSDVSGQILGEGDNFGREVVHAFKVGGYAGISDPLFLRAPEVFPNPASEQTSISFTLLRPQDVSLRVMDAAGREVFARTYPSLSAGEQMLNLPLSGFGSGLYLLRLEGDGEVVTKKFNVLR